jgi:hypothetical protein
MPRSCSVCAHQRRGEIDRILVSGAPLRETSAVFRVSEDALGRHKAAHLPATLLRAQEATDLATAAGIAQALRTHLLRVQLLYDACDAWLRDPNDLSRYDIGPRAEDVRVTYSESGPDGKPVRKRARLSELLARVETGRDLTVERGEYRHADPRELLLKTAGQLHSHLDLLTKLLQAGEFEQRLAALEAAQHDATQRTSA